MGIAYDIASTATQATNPASVTFSHAVGSITNGILLVFIHQDNNASAPADAVTGVTYNGVAMTRIGTVVSAAGALGFERTTVYGLLNPATGAHNVVVSFTGTANQVDCGAVSYSGVSQSTAIASLNKVTNSAASGSTFALSLTAAATSWLAGSVSQSQNTTSASTNTTSRVNWSASRMIADSNGVSSPTALNFTNLSSGAWSGIAVELAPATASVKNLAALGVG